MSEPIIPVILSGGGGTRLWPVSTGERPKQFIDLVGPHSLLRDTIDRTAGVAGFRDAMIVANVRHADLCRAEMGALGRATQLMLEPVARNTAAAILMAAIELSTVHGAECLLLVMPSDHVIADVPAFLAAVQRGAGAASRGYLVTFGIRPTAPETGFGYLETGAELDGLPGVFSVARFEEKPQRVRAEEMVAGGRHSWNAGIFLFQAGSLIAAAQDVAPDILARAREAVAGAHRDGQTIVPEEASLRDCPNESIDYAIMEKAERVAVVPMSPGWSDVGSWDALAEMDDDPVKGPVTLVDCDGIYARSDGIEIAGIGLENLIVVASGNKLLIMPKGRSQDVKSLLAAVERKS